MKTDDLIRSLAADQGWHEAPVAQALWRALLVALPVSAIIFVAELDCGRISRRRFAASFSI